MSKANIKFFIATITLLIVRVWLGRITSVWFPADQYFDDGLMMRYANLHDHFITQTSPFNIALLNDIGFPLFLNFVNVSGLQYTDSLVILWFIAAILSVVLFSRVTGISRRKILLAVYAFVLFAPVAFDQWCGTRLYRAGLLTPLYFIVLNSISILVVKHFEDLKINLIKFLLFQVCLGVIFTFTFYVKEDGIWLLACLVFATAICFLRLILRNSLSIGRRFIHAVVLLMPIVIFWCGTTFYKQVNYEHFGVYAINIRTEGEIGKFVKYVYKTKSDSRTKFVWSPSDAIQQMIEVSDTLKNNPGLCDAIIHTPWFGGDITQHQIQGDFLGWVILAAVKDSGTCNSNAEAEELFRQINIEVEEAFDAGVLQKASEIQLVSSMGGRSIEEIFDLKELVAAQYAMHVTTYKYDPGSSGIRVPNEENITPDEQNLIRFAVDLTNINLTELNQDADFANRCIIVLFNFYTLLQIALFIFAFIGVGWGIREIYRRKIKMFDKNFLAVSIAFGNFLLSIFYAVAIAWFCEFIGGGELPDLRYAAVKFYSVGLVPLLMTFEILGTYLFWIRQKNREG